MPWASRLRRHSGRHDLPKAPSFAKPSTPPHPIGLATGQAARNAGDFHAEEAPDSFRHDGGHHDASIMMLASRCWHHGRAGIRSEKSPSWNAAAFGFRLAGFEKSVDFPLTENTPSDGFRPEFHRINGSRIFLDFRLTKLPGQPPLAGFDPAMPPFTASRDDQEFSAFSPGFGCKIQKMHYIMCVNQKCDGHAIRVKSAGPAHCQK